MASQPQCKGFPRSATSTQRTQNGRLAPNRVDSTVAQAAIRLMLFDRVGVWRCWVLAAERAHSHVRRFGWAKHVTRQAEVFDNWSYD